VYDAGHALIATFADAEEAHGFAHEACRAPGVLLPLEVEDRSTRTSRLVWTDRCQSVCWLALERHETCSHVRPSVMLAAVATGSPTRKAG
jgi:hypothetical protein